MKTQQPEKANGGTDMMSGGVAARALADERGMVLVVALVLLLMMTLIGVAATNTTTTETMIAGAERDKRAAFYAAEAGIDHGVQLITSLYAARNSAKLALVPPSPDWDFILNGSEAGVGAATSTDYAGSAALIVNRALGDGHTYTVRVWNNTDSGSASDDSDNLIFLRSHASKPDGGSADIVVKLRGGIEDPGSSSGYSAQAGAGSGKNYTADDASAMTSFDQQL